MGMQITVLDDIIADISSTEIRTSKTKAQKYLPKEIYDYILEKSIYFEKN